MPNLNARLSRAEQAAQAKRGSSLVVFLEDGIYYVDGKTFATLEDVRAEAARQGVKADKITIIEFAQAEL